MTDKKKSNTDQLMELFLRAGTNSYNTDQSQRIDELVKKTHNNYDILMEEINDYYNSDTGVFMISGTRLIKIVESISVIYDQSIEWGQMLSKKFMDLQKSHENQIDHNVEFAKTMQGVQEKLIKAELGKQDAN